MSVWNDLFAAASPSTAVGRVQMRELRKQGRPLLLLPRSARPAAQCLDLYPAQSGRARLARAVLRGLIRVGVVPGSNPVGLNIPATDPFIRFLHSTAGTKKQLPDFGILAGNPAGGTQRFIVLLFDDKGNPQTVVKAGVAPAARELIKKERDFLSSVPAGEVGIPQLRSKFASASVEAFATNFFVGGPPQPDDDRLVSRVLSSWITQRMPLRQFPGWVAFEKAFPQAAKGTSDRLVQSVIQHGDFAPWNIKVSRNGSFTVLDWERGTLNGLPGWDWFHYVIQTNILVRKATTENLVRTVEQLLNSGSFKGYAQKTGIAGLERPLLLAYLAHVVNVIEPAEGLEQTRALVEALHFVL
jgi:hypothetical protein